MEATRRRHLAGEGGTGALLQPHESRDRHRYVPSVIYHDLSAKQAKQMTRLQSLYKTLDSNIAQQLIAISYQV